MKRLHTVVTGVTGGVGRAVADLLMLEGHYVYATCRSKAQQKDLEQSGCCHKALLVDLANESCAEQLQKALSKEDIDTLDRIVLSAAVSKPQAMELMSDEDVRRTFQVNLFSNVSLIRQTLPLLKKSKGRVVWVGSTAGSTVMPLLGAYSATKHAVEAMVDALRQEFAVWDVPVSLVTPAAIKTPMAENLVKDARETARNLEGDTERQYESLYRMHANLIQSGLKMGVTPEKVANDIYKALTDEKPKSRYYCGLQPAVISKLFGNLPDCIVDKMYTNPLVEDDNLFPQGSREA